MPNPHERFTTLYSTYQARVYGYAVSRAGHQLAEQVVSATFLVAWRRLDDIPGHAQLRWLFRVARNIVRDNLRQAARHESLEADLRTWMEHAVTDVGEHATELLTILRALATPSEDDKEILTLTTWHGLPAAEAGEVLGCTKATFFVRLHRARRRLQSAIDTSGITPSLKPVIIPGGGFNEP
ncbi:RNA polymerase sigma factor [Nonomuraea sp. SYSU D8015]|uniref:RNA polymerase sigma factor n=1 Tax=Nonomuraea sp. SYSU D8015 TaxID=2593644 RepID=UPI001661244E|nr:RNA polymerase sigma factor [Nonomuraea sp. SYSU D8015]